MVLTFHMMFILYFEINKWHEHNNDVIPKIQWWGGNKNRGVCSGLFSNVCNAGMQIATIEIKLHFKKIKTILQPRRNKAPS